MHFQFDCNFIVGSSDALDSVMVEIEENGMGPQSWRFIENLSFPLFLDEMTQCEEHFGHALVIIHHSDILSIENLMHLFRHYALVIVEFESLEQVRVKLANASLDVTSQVYITLADNSLEDNVKVYEVFKASSNRPITVQLCGFWNRNMEKICDLLSGVAHRRLDLQGITLSAVYDSWDPFCIIGSNNELVGGIFPEIFQRLSDALYFTAK